MTDLWVLAVGLGAMPLAAILWYLVPRTVLDRRERSWGFLAGVIAFLALSHSMTVLLVNEPLLAFVVGGGSSLVTAIIGLLLGAGFAWVLFEGPLLRTEPLRLVGASVVFVALHSLNDGIVLGGDFVGGAVPAIRIDALVVGATFLHRFLEGSLVILAALAAAWRIRVSFAFLSVGLFTALGAYIPNLLFDPSGGGAVAAGLAVPMLLVGIEAGLGFILLVRGFLPMAMTAGGTRWAAWCVVGFLAISLMHFAVE